LKQAEGIVYTGYTQVHHYASVDMPISVHTDLSNVNISVPDQPATTQKQ
jgi:hypothetical protein